MSLFIGLLFWILIEKEVGKKEMFICKFINSTINDLFKILSKID
jgi:hypothetical protein